MKTAIFILFLCGLVVSLALSAPKPIVVVMFKTAKSDSDTTQVDRIATVYQGATMTQILQDWPIAAGRSYWSIDGVFRTENARGGWYVNLTASQVKVAQGTDSLKVGIADSVAVYDARFR